MIAFIYIAGMALRLGPEHADQPKVLLKFGGKSLLEWHVHHLTRHNIHRIILITGHKREKIQQEIKSLELAYSAEIKEIYNENFSEGSVLSFHVSLPEILNTTDTLLLMDGDVLYPKEMLSRLIRSKYRTSLLIDRHYSTRDDDPVLVPIRDGKPFEFVKKWTGSADQVGESIGFFKIAPADIPLLAEKTDQFFKAKRRRESYDEVIRALVQTGSFGYEDVTGIPWTEIDFPEDIVHAQKIILPAITRYEKN